MGRGGRGSLDKEYSSPRSMRTTPSAATLRSISSRRMSWVQKKKELLLESGEDCYIHIVRILDTSLWYTIHS